MRHSNQFHRGRRRPFRLAGGATPATAMVGLALIVLIAAGCGGATAASSSPTALPTPLVTPDPHLREPVTADQIWGAIARGHMSLVPSNATISEGTIVKRINADLEGWTLRITAYTNAAAMKKAKVWLAGEVPGTGDAPYNFAGLNIMVEYGPTSRAGPPPQADPEHRATAEKLLGILDPLLWPIDQHSVLPIPSRTIPPVVPTAAPTKAPKSPVPAKSKAP
ncbi:MAG TPA: hypothetical protein VFY18_13590 [Candidatus Limnocylindrales bacterium]|nr:hypothetical protein [Candidatus Limnocylindrales bacterium]